MLNVPKTVTVSVEVHNIVREQVMSLETAVL